MKRWKRLAVLLCVLGAATYGLWKALPVNRVAVKSELVMLGDLDGDRRWGPGDLTALEAFRRDPFTATDALALTLDLNQNGLLDDEDLAFLRALAESKDPYTAEAAAHARGEPFPRARELYRYVSVAEFKPRPAFGLPHDAQGSAITWLGKVRPAGASGHYADALDAALYSEAVRLDFAQRKRASGLTPLEQEYAGAKLSRCQELFDTGDRFELLLELISLVEDAETLTARGQGEGPIKLLRFRDHLRELLASPLYAEFTSGQQDWRAVLKVVERGLSEDLGLAYELEKLGPVRDLGQLENYLKRAEWQYYKSSTQAAEFIELVQYAQHDPRYLRAVARTSRKLEDVPVRNHNLPMVLLFREALRIEGGDKKKAVGLLDEAIRIPYGWMKSIPRESLPASLALENFLLPGNKEDGADKSRHWNVFGGLCLYKSPEEALDLALKREMGDLRDAGYSSAAMTEFLRDMIANLNGMYHVMAVQPDLLTKP